MDDRIRHDPMSDHHGSEAHATDRHVNGDPAAHLQQAALELIAAWRGVLDLAEQAVREPGGIAAVVNDTVAAFLSMVPRAARAPEPPMHDTVEHIRIS